MLEEIINNPAIEKYMVTFKEGEILCIEGDESQDLYILVEGEVVILKGNQRISEVVERGSSLGEMSFLLGAKRTATLKAGSNGKAIRIPQEKIHQFLKEFPNLAWQIPRVLAQRLEERTQAFYALKEFCDQLPDAVVATDREGNLISWNSAAERLFGKTWEQMKRGAVEEIYEEPEAYRQFLQEVQTEYSVRERILKVRHPEKGIRHISTSTTVLYDGHHNFQGVLSLNRDVTEMQNLQRKYKRARFWSIPFLVLLGFVVAGLFFVYPRFSGRAEIVSMKQKTLKDQLAKDYLLVKSLLIDSFAKKEREKINQLVKKFFEIQENTGTPYLGLVLLDDEKRVFGAYSLKGEKMGEGIVGSSYARIPFRGDEKSLHKVLILYRADSQRPTGRRGVEIAFEMKKGDLLLGWLLFQMNMDRLENDFEVDEALLQKFRF